LPLRGRSAGGAEEALATAGFGEVLVLVLVLAVLPVSAAALAVVLVAALAAAVLLAFDAVLADADAVPWHELSAKALRAPPAAAIATRRIRRLWAVTRPTVP
jgi:hypothetical protein